MMQYGVIRGQQGFSDSALGRFIDLGLLALDIDGERRRVLVANVYSFAATVGGREEFTPQLYKAYRAGPRAADQPPKISPKVPIEWSPERPSFRVSLGASLQF